MKHTYQHQTRTLAVVAGLIVLLLLGLFVLKRFRICRIEQESSRNDNEAVKNEGAKKRVRSIDTVRGMSILLMIFVNSGAGGYYFSEHTTWDGLLIGDLVFPTFMWIMGVCIPLSISSQLSRGISKFSVCQAIVKRSFCLFCIGVALNTLGGRNQIEDIRIFGVLQRFSIAYLVVGVTYALMCTTEDGNSEAGPIRDISILVPQWIIALSVLAAHCFIVFLLPVPGCPKGYFGPGGRHADSKYLNCTGGATGYVDKLLLGENHIFRFPTTDKVYGSGRFDPEGILGCLTSIFQVFLGVQAGQTMRIYKGWKSRILRWLTWALVLGVIGISLHFTKVVPVNKNLWSISFVMVTTCFSLGLLSASYLFTDVLNIWDGGPFRIPGMNSTVMYIGHQIFYVLFPFHWKIGKMNTHSWQLAENLWVVTVWTCIAYILHRKRIYVTL
ncbi:hypothetical protein QAD02_009564 [Eretmocerus hayati]|uniref:Uncharacterized protein n=1 Tax=Eretmocerus hayati TaxID=131215 RepID=A0ACC2NB21_9HYME|nr:hypothetical protein QAD02_009564 [Eretmocerus hayati]